MHDWTLVSIHFEWKFGRITIEMKDTASVLRTLVTEGVRELYVPHANEWGPSVSVNNVAEVETLPDGGRRLRIEMQSGDVIQIVAERIVLPIEPA